SSETNNSPRLIINYGPPDPVSIAELSNSKEVGIYPNPVKGLLSIDIKFNERMPLSVDIIDIIGNIIISQQTYNGGIDISKLPKGMYFLRITYQNQEIIKKLVKE
ncbi:MAG: T9SS type A sorting domain-containing protein, partial [Bacteroidia bacterium]|nr:T9SS type A sorting domain-containing protein [Bacteroidia bacterium]